MCGRPSRIVSRDRYVEEDAARHYDDADRGQPDRYYSVGVALEVRADIADYADRTRVRSMFGPRHA
jgi:hypothetical protein